MKTLRYLFAGAFACYFTACAENARGPGGFPINGDSESGEEKPSGSNDNPYIQNEEKIDVPEVAAGDSPEMIEFKNQLEAYVKIVESKKSCTSSYECAAVVFPMVEGDKRTAPVVGYSTAASDNYVSSNLEKKLLPAFRAAFPNETTKLFKAKADYRTECQNNECKVMK